MTRNKAPLEKTIQKNILRYLNSLPRCRARNHTASGPYNQSGEPDIDGCLNGRSLKIEVKRPGGSPLTDLQQKALQEWAHVGAITGVAYSVEDVQQILREHGVDDFY